MRMPQLSKGSNGGFTLVELLVVLLIIVILAVGLLPLFSKDITRATYVREAVPLISNIRTKVELFRYDKNRLPGLPYDKSTKAVYEVAMSGAAGNYAVGTMVSYSDLTLAAGAGLTGGATLDSVQYMEQVVDAADKLVDMYYSGSVSLTDASGAQVVGVGDISDHVWKCIGMDSKDLTGVRLRPQHVHYAALGSINNSTYYWVVGVFGDGKGGLKAGCGYAVAEFVDVLNKRKFVATFERFDPLSTDPLQFELGLSIGDGNTYLTDPAKQNQVPLPDFDALIAPQTETAFNAIVGEMGIAGWSFGN